MALINRKFQTKLYSVLYELEEIVFITHFQIVEMCLHFVTFALLLHVKHTHFYTFVLLTVECAFCREL